MQHLFIFRWTKRSVLVIVGWVSLTYLKYFRRTMRTESLPDQVAVAQKITINS